MANHARLNYIDPSLRGDWSQADLDAIMVEIVNSEEWKAMEKEMLPILLGD